MAITNINPSVTTTDNSDQSTKSFAIDAAKFTIGTADIGTLAGVLTVKKNSGTEGTINIVTATGENFADGSTIYFDLSLATTVAAVEVTGVEVVLSGISLDNTTGYGYKIAESLAASDDATDTELMTLSESTAGEEYDKFTLDLSDEANKVTIEADGTKYMRFKVKMVEPTPAGA